jgi:hypothetical protein
VCGRSERRHNSASALMSRLGLVSALSIATLGPGRRPLTIFAVCAALVANCGGVLAETPLFNDYYLHARLAPCRDLASATCHRRPQVHTSVALETSPNALPSVEFGWAFGPGSVRLQGNAELLRLEVHNTTIAAVLATLKRVFGVRYRFSTPMDDVVNGTFSGSLTRVMASILDGYNYVIKREGVRLDLIIYGRSAGEGAPAASSATVAPVRTHRCGRSAGHQAACPPI